MDNLTHTLIGANLARAFFVEEVGPEAMPILCWSSNLPDLDVAVLALRDPLAVTLRRTWGHSLFTLPLLVAGLAWVFKKRYPRLGYWTLFKLCFIGAGVHLLFDLVNSFGVRLTWPFSPWRPELGWLFIVDVVLLAILVAPFLLRLMPPRRSSQAAVAAATAYLLFCAAGRALSCGLLSRETPSASFRYVFPEPLGPQNWRGVALEGGAYAVYAVRPWSGTIEKAGDVPTQAADPQVEQARASEPGRRLEAFFKAPVWRLEGPGHVRAFDLRFRSLILRRGGGFSFLLTRQNDGSWRASH